MPAKVTSSGTVTCRSISSAEAPGILGHDLDDGRRRVGIGFHVDVHESIGADPGPGRWQQGAPPADYAATTGLRRVP